MKKQPVSIHQAQYDAAMAAIDRILAELDEELTRKEAHHEADRD